MIPAMPPEIPPLPLTFGERSGEKTIQLVRAAVRMAVIERRESPPRWLFVSHPQKGLELPGGAVDPEEDAATAARRELAEEAGLVLPPGHPVYAAGSVPIRDGNGGHWLDLVYYTFRDQDFDSQHAVRSQKNSASRAPEFPLAWLSEAEMDGRLSRNAQAVVDCVARALVSRQA